MEYSSLRTAMIAWFLVISSVLALSGNDTDKHSLLEFKAKIQHDPLGLLNSWNDSVNFCSWPGVACSQRHRQRVTALNLPSLKLKGQLSPHIGNLSFLRVLNLENNSFSHEIPQEIGRLFRLHVLRFTNNSFSSEIPVNISGCFSLQFLHMRNNNFTGRIPKEIGSLSELRMVVLGNKNLVGEIPASIGNLSLLKQLYLGESSFQGNIPISFGQLKSLEVLVLQRNNLTGTIPVSLYNISSIKAFSMLENNLEGSLPSNLCLTLPNLRFFSIENNYHIYGSIPSSVSNASNLEMVHLRNNELTGKIPNFARHLNLFMLTLGYNNLGSAENGDLNFLRDLVNCTRLEVLAIENNNIGGEIPEAIGNMTSSKLRRLVFGSNKIWGEIPTEIGNLVSLDALGLEANDLTGPIPSTIGKLRNMIGLTFYTNKLSGTIPTSLGNLTSLSTLSLGRNNLQGTIPPSLGECRNLQVLNLAENNLSGPIPPQVFSLSSLTQHLFLSRNQLTGSIPIEVGKLVNLGRLDVYENKISGQIPKSLGRCMSMEYLYLQGNFLQGPIPEELSTLRGVQEIDFSRNNLSGQVPIYFADFRGLQFLNFSFNEFEGQVPIQGIFKNASKFSITGNSRLCGGLPEFELPICTSHLIKTKKLSTKKKLVIIIASAVVGLMVLIFLVLMLMFRTRKRSKPITEQSFPNSLPRVSYEDLSNATGGFASENVIGSGSYGSVYKGILSQEERHVAVKILNLDISRALRSFIVECESLGSIRHRNIVKLITVCSSIDFKGNDFKALVYEYMENGNLDEWLHRGTEQSRHLNLIQRINIAIDVTSALDYLHNHCFEPIAHCDIKPSNILLDEQMVAHVGDFGLAKLLRSAFPSSNNQSSSNGVRGTVGYVPPEYATGNEVSTLGDIYSYGILLLELLSGKRPTDGMFKDDFNLQNFASLALREENVRKIVDPKLLEEEELEEGQRIGNGTRSHDNQDQELNECLISIIEIGVLCSSKSPEERMNMGHVAAELCRIRNILRRTHDG